MDFYTWNAYTAHNDCQWFCLINYLVNKWHIHIHRCHRSGIITLLNELLHVELSIVWACWVWNVFAYLYVSIQMPFIHLFIHPSYFFSVLVSLMQNKEWEIERDRKEKKKLNRMQYVAKHLTYYTFKWVFISNYSSNKYIETNNNWIFGVWLADDQ